MNGLSRRVPQRCEQCVGWAPPTIILGAQVGAMPKPKAQPGGQRPVGHGRATLGHGTQAARTVASAGYGACSVSQSRSGPVGGVSAGESVGGESAGDETGDGAAGDEPACGTWARFST